MSEVPEILKGVTASVPDRAARRQSFSMPTNSYEYNLDLAVSKRPNSMSKYDNPKWSCEACGNKGAQDYAGVGRICKDCADRAGY